MLRKENTLAYAGVNQRAQPWTAPGGTSLQGLALAGRSTGREGGREPLYAPVSRNQILSILTYLGQGTRGPFCACWEIPHLSTGEHCRGLAYALSSSINGSLPWYHRPLPRPPHKSQPLQMAEHPTTGKPGAQGRAGDTERGQPQPRRAQVSLGSSWKAKAVGQGGWAGTGTARAGTEGRAASRAALRLPPLPCASPTAGTVSEVAG